MDNSSSSKSRRLSFFVAIFGLAGTGLLLASFAGSNTSYFEAESYSSYVGSVRACRPSGGKEFVVMGGQCPAGTTEFTDRDLSNVPTKNSLDCEASRLNPIVKLSDEAAETSNLKLAALNTPATASERTEITRLLDEREAKAKNFETNIKPRPSLGDFNGVTHFVRTNVTEKTTNGVTGDTRFYGFPRAILGKVGFTATELEPDGERQFNVKAFESHRAVADPIVAPCQETFGHEHLFFGNSTVDGYSTTTSLFGGPSTANPIAQAGNDYVADSSAYWIPTLKINGKAPKTIQLSLYYSNPSGNWISREKRKTTLPVQPVQAFPLGLRMIAGNANAKSPGEMSNAVHYTFTGSKCGGLTRADKKTSLSQFRSTSWGPGCTVRMFVRFPGWWDGEHLYKPDQSHMSYTKTATHTVALPSLTYVIPFKVDNAFTGQDLLLSAGQFYTLHADFWNAWDGDLLQTLIDKTINSAQNWQGWQAYSADTAFKPIDIKANQTAQSVSQCLVPTGVNRATYKFDLHQAGKFNTWVRARSPLVDVAPGQNLLSFHGVKIDGKSNSCGVEVTVPDNVNPSNDNYQWVWLKADKKLDFSTIDAPHELSITSTVGGLQIDGIYTTQSDCNPNSQDCGVDNSLSEEGVVSPEQPGHVHDQNRDNILPFGNFETTQAEIDNVYFGCSNGTPDCKKDDYPPGVSFGISDKKAHGGNQSLLIESESRPVSEKQFIGNKNKLLSAEPDKSYTASAYSQWQSASSDLPQVRLTFLDENGGTLSTSTDSFAGAGSDWSQASTTATSPAGTAYVKLSLYVYGTGTFWFDDAELLLSSKSGDIPSEPDPSTNPNPPENPTTDPPSANLPVFFEPILPEYSRPDSDAQGGDFILFQ